MNIIEKRFAKRLNIDLHLYIRWEGRLIPCRANNISPCGITIETKALSCPPQIPVAVCFSLGNSRYEIEGTTTYNLDTRIGIEFNQPQPELSKLIYEQKLNHIKTA